MLRQKRIPRGVSVNHSLNCYANENIALLSASHEVPSNTFTPLEPKLTSKTKRTGLS
jgi:hypothetical protein